MRLKLSSLGFIKRLTGTVGVLLVLASPLATAQLLKYLNESELLGAAAVSPGSAREVITRLVAHCAAFGPAVKTAGEGELKAWVSRHQIYLDEHLRVRAEYFAYAAKHYNARDKEAFDTMFTVSLPKMLDAQLATYVIHVDSMPSQELKVSTCREYFQAIADEKFDLKNNDPSLLAYFERRLKNASSRSAPPPTRAIPAKVQHSDPASK